MNMRINFTRISRNKKTGPMPVSASEPRTCPSTCGLKKNGCYAESGPLSVIWNRVAEQGLTWDQFLKAVKSLPLRTSWRHNQAGDLAGQNDVIDGPALKELVKANRGRRGFTYTHYPMTEHNSALISYANENGFTVNLSADNLEQADQKAKHGPTVVVLPAEAGKSIRTPEGREVLICPAYASNVTCSSCGLCQQAKRKFVIGFPAHGTGRKKASLVALGAK